MRISFKLAPISVMLIAALNPAMSWARVSDDVAKALVSSRLPEAQIVKALPGPGDTVEVMFGLQGIYNLQSIYVLSDGQTAISGIVLPVRENVADAPAPEKVEPTQAQSAMPQAENITLPAPTHGIFSKRSDEALASFTKFANTALEPSIAHIVELYQSSKQQTAGRPAGGLYPHEAAYKSAIENLPSVSFSTGTPNAGTKQVYVLFDINCPFCHEFFQRNVVGNEQAKDVTINWIPAALFYTPKDSSEDAKIVAESSVLVAAHMYWVIRTQGNQAAKAALTDYFINSTKRLNFSEMAFQEQDMHKAVEATQLLASQQQPRTPLISYTERNRGWGVIQSVPPAAQWAELQSLLVTPPSISQSEAKK